MTEWRKNAAPALRVSGEQIRAARALIRIDQTELARWAKVSVETIKRLERVRGPVDANLRTIKSIVDAFAEQGVYFDVYENGGVAISHVPVG